MSEQDNFFQLNTDHSTDDSRLMPQRTDAWFATRGKAMVTGSTCQKAVGLGKLKEQQEHYDHVVRTIDRTPGTTEEIQRRMEYGTVHEIDATASLINSIEHTRTDAHTHAYTHIHLGASLH
jgi:hypothetical protein